MPGQELRNVRRDGGIGHHEMLLGPRRQTQLIDKDQHVRQDQRDVDEGGVRVGLMSFSGIMSQRGSALDCMPYA